MSRPSKRTPEIEEEILTRIADGETLTGICRGENMPTRRTVQNWAVSDEGFFAAIARAREAQADVYAEEIVEIADEVNGETENAAVQAAKLRVDSRKWATAKLQPRKYGEFQRTELTGEVDVKLTDEQLESRLAQLLGKAGVVAPSGGAGEKGKP